MILLFRNIADAPWLLGLNFVAVFGAFAAIQFIALPLNSYPDGSNLPDARILGYTPSELNTWLDNIGVEGCRVYVKVATWDLCVIMPSYVLLLGAVLSKLTRRRRRRALPESLAYLAVLTGLCDTVETYCQRRACIVFPGRLSDNVILVASTACQSKWVLLFGTISLILVLFVQEFYSPNRHDNNNTAKSE